MKKILFYISLAVLGWILFGPQPKAQWGGQLAKPDPVQVTEDLPSAWKWGKDVTVTPAARYQMKAVVLSKHHYWAGEIEDQLAPYDLALGWGPMSDAAVINALKISQGGRWYNYSWSGSPPIESSEIIRHSANNHIIASNQNVSKQIAAIKRHDVVVLKGYLVNISRPNGWSWHTSLTRDDDSGGSCELFWVESLERTPQP